MSMRNVDRITPGVENILTTIVSDPDHSSLGQLRESMLKCSLQRSVFAPLPEEDDMF